MLAQLNQKQRHMLRSLLVGAFIVVAFLALGLLKLYGQSRVATDKSKQPGD